MYAKKKRKKSCQVSLLYWVDSSIKILTNFYFPALIVNDQDQDINGSQNLDKEKDSRTKVLDSTDRVAQTSQLISCLSHRILFLMISKYGSAKSNEISPNIKFSPFSRHCVNRDIAPQKTQCTRSSTFIKTQLKGERFVKI